METEIPLLTPASLVALVDEGLQIATRLAADGKRQKEIEALLKNHALSVPGQHAKLVDAEREGTRFLVPGTDGRSVSVVFTSDLLMQTITEGTPNFERIRDFPGRPLAVFFKPTKQWEAILDDGKKFRKEARLRLEDPERFITACIRRDKAGTPVSQIKVEWPG